MSLSFREQAHEPVAMYIRRGQSEKIVKVGHVLGMVAVEIDKIERTISQLLHVCRRSQDPSSLTSDLFHQLLSLLVRLIEQELYF